MRRSLARPPAASAGPVSTWLRTVLIPFLRYRGGPTKTLGVLIPRQRAMSRFERRASRTNHVRGGSE
ncbi:hypothetical protein CO709_24370 [Burkholderia thailandensis]|nr:hypothetical protein CO709_24370 [Burkholderia thailandensis]